VITMQTWGMLCTAAVIFLGVISARCAINERNDRKRREWTKQCNAASVANMAQGISKRYMKLTSLSMLVDDLIHEAVMGKTMTYIQSENFNKKVNRKRNEEKALMEEIVSYVNQFIVPATEVQGEASISADEFLKPAV
jgi:hypothetical protein